MQIECAAIKALPSTDASLTTGSETTQPHTKAARSPTASLTSLCRMIKPPFLQIRAWSSEKGEPQPLKLEGTFNRGFQ